MKENQYQGGLIKKIEKRFPGSLVMRTNSEHIQGLPDLLILYKEHWAALEVKASDDAPVQPNQSYYINLLDNLSFAAYIYPENEEEILSALQQAFEPPG